MIYKTLREPRWIHEVHPSVGHELAVKRVVYSYDGHMLLLSNNAS